MTGLGFVLEMARREARGQARRLGPFVAAVAVGVGALVAINSFTENLQDTVRDQARALLGADLALSSPRKFPPRGEALVAEMARAAGGATTARVTSFAAMAWVPGTSGARLVQVAAVERGYPFYGRIETDPPGGWSRLTEGAAPGRFALVDPALLVSLDARVGDTLAVSATPDGAACGVYGAAFAELLRLLVGFEGAMLHTACRTGGAPQCEWRAAPPDSRHH